MLLDHIHNILSQQCLWMCVVTFRAMLYNYSLLDQMVVIIIVIIWTSNYLPTHSDYYVQV